jgi:hypothetical protein
VHPPDQERYFLKQKSPALLPTVSASSRSVESQEQKSRGFPVAKAYPYLSTPRPPVQIKWNSFCMLKKELSRLQKEVEKIYTCL